MKFVKRISTFFILPMFMFSVGFASSMAIDEYFYPGKKNQVKQPITAEEEQTKLETVPVVLSEEPLINADTMYMIQEYDGITGMTEEFQESVPDRYIGLSREEFLTALEEYNLNPSLQEQERGFEGCELVSFSRNRVVIRKTYTREEIPPGYFLLNEDNYVTVYYADMETLYMSTNIRTSSLPFELQKEIINIKFMEEEEELYIFLEAYSS